MVCPFAIGKLRRLRLPLPPKTHQIGVVEALQGTTATTLKQRDTAPAIEP